MENKKEVAGGAICLLMAFIVGILAWTYSVSLIGAAFATISAGCVFGGIVSLK